MAYTPDPTDATNPTDSISAETAQAEFRALKAYLAANLAVISGGNLGGLLFKDNLFINGEMNVWQRGAGGAASFAAPATASFSADQWRLDYSGAARVTVAQVAGMDQYSPFSMQLTVTTPSGALGAGDFYTLSQRVIARKAGRLGWGAAANARTVSASFIGSFPTAGLHTFFIQNSAQNRSYVATFNVLPAQAGMATLFQLPGIPGDIAGTWLTGTNGVGVIAGIVLAAGSNFSNVNHNLWQAGNFLTTAGCVNELAVNAAVIKLGRIRFTDESGCSPFVSKGFDADLLDCLPYYEKSYEYAVAPGTAASSVSAILLYIQYTAASAYPMNLLVRYEAPKIVTPTVALYSDVTGTVARFRDNSSNVDSGANISSLSGKNSVVVSSNCTAATTIMQLSGHFTADAGL